MVEQSPDRGRQPNGVVCPDAMVPVALGQVGVVDGADPSAGHVRLQGRPGPIGSRARMAQHLDRGPLGKVSRRAST